MLTVINKTDRTALVPFDSIDISQVAGDPLSKANFQIIDPTSSISVQALQEVIFFDENVALTPSGVVASPFSDSFASNDISNYTSTFNPGPPGSAATWTITPADTNHTLLLFPANAASTTISTANQLYTVSGSPATANTLTTCNGSTGWGEIPAQGSAAAWPALGSIGSPSGKGFFLDASALAGKTISGNWSGNERLSANSATGTVTTNIVVRVYRYRSGTYTNIVTWTLTGQVLPSTPASVSLPSTAGTTTSFVTGDHLYIEYWCDITSNTSGTGQQIRHNRLSTDTSGFTGDPLIQITSPGYTTTNQSTLAASNGFYALLQLNNWTAQNVTVSATMLASDFGGLAFNIVDTQDYYELAVRDASSPVPNSLQLFKTINGIRSAIGASTSISFTRGTSHTIACSSFNNGSSTTIAVAFDGTQVYTYVDSTSPLGLGGVGLRDDTFSGASSALFDTFSATSNDIPALMTSVPTHNYIDNNNFNFGSGVWALDGSLSGLITFPSNPTFGSGAKISMTFANSALGLAGVYRFIPNQYSVVGATYCASATYTATGLTNASAFIEVSCYDSSSLLLDQVIPITSSGRFSATFTAPTGTIGILIEVGGQTTVGGSNAGTITVTGLQIEPVWFPAQYSYPSPICDFLQSDCITLPDGTTSRYDRIFTGFITDIKVSYQGATRIYDLEATSADWLMENATLVNATYNSATDQSIITGVVNAVSPAIIYAATPSLATSTPAALAYRNVPVVYAGTTLTGLQFADASIREVLNACADVTGFIFGVDAYYNLFYYPPFYNIAAYGFSSSPNGTTTFPYYDYSIEYDASQLQSAINVAGTTFSTTVTEAWHFQDGSHTETVQSGKTVNVLLNFSPNAVPSTVTIGGTGISCAQDTNVGYGTALSIVTVAGGYGLPNLLSFPSPGYAATTSISVVYAYDTLAYVTTQSPDSIAQYGRAVWGKIQDSSLASNAACTTAGEATLQTYAQPRITLNFKCQKMLQPGQVIAFTSTPDSITAQHFTVQKVDVKSLGTGINEYTVQAGTYLDDFVDFFRNTQKALTRANHDPAAPIQATHLLQQDSMSISDSLNIHT